MSKLVKGLLALFFVPIWFIITMGVSCFLIFPHVFIKALNSDVSLLDMWLDLMDSIFDSFKEL